MIKVLIYIFFIKIICCLFLFQFLHQLNISKFHFFKKIKYSQYLIDFIIQYNYQHQDYPMLNNNL